MPYGIIHFFPGGTQAQYEASVAAVHPGTDQLPPGQIYHAAGPSEGGWTVIAIHDTKVAWEQFRDQVLMPKLQAGVPGGFTTPPEERAFDVIKLLKS